MLAYRMPRDPSNPRVALWRKLRRLGAIQLVDGLVALPAAAHTIEQFDWLAEEVTEAGGEATTWIARATSAGQERMVARRMADAAAQEYRAVATEASAALEATPAASKRVLARLREGQHRGDAGVGSVEGIDPFVTGAGGERLGEEGLQLGPAATVAPVG